MNKEDVQKFIEANQPEIYWDRGDALSDAQISQILSSENGLDEVSETLWDMNIDHIFELEDDLIQEVISEFELSEGDSGEEFKDFCRDHISVDMNIDSLIKNVGNQVFFYDTGVSTKGYGQSPAEYRAEMKKIKKSLGVKNNIYDKELEQMLLEASYGGQLVVYFMANLYDIINEEKIPSIQFWNMNIAIIDTYGGSGSDCFIAGYELIVPFDRSKIFFEKSIKYNYSFAVCGMIHDWCSDTQWGFATAKVRKKPAKKSAIQLTKELNAQYDKVFASGKCSFGDMDINRHRKVEYINNYPCGNKCLDCGTFWID